MQFFSPFWITVSSPKNKLAYQFFPILNYCYISSDSSTHSCQHLSLLNYCDSFPESKQASHLFSLLNYSYISPESLHASHIFMFWNYYYISTENIHTSALLPTGLDVYLLQVAASFLDYGHIVSGNMPERLLNYFSLHCILNSITLQYIFLWSKYFSLYIYLCFLDGVIFTKY